MMTLDPKGLIAAVSCHGPVLINTCFGDYRK